MQTAVNPIADRISSISVSSTMKVSSDAEKLRAEGVDVVDFGQGRGRQLGLRSGYDVLAGRVITCLVLAAAAQGRQRQGVAS